MSDYICGERQLIDCVRIGRTVVTFNRLIDYVRVGKTVVTFSR